MAVPTTTAETDSSPLYAPNDPCPDPWSQYLPNAFSDRVYTTLTRNRVPWLIIKQLADEGWTDVTSLTKRWGAEDQLYKHAADSLRITHLPQHQQEKIIATIAGAREDLKTLKDHQATLSTRPKAAQIVDNLDRETMELAFQRVTQEKLKLKYQGSSNLLGKLHKAMAEGRIENLQFKDLVAFHPAPSSRNSTQQIRNPDGSYAEVEVQTRRMATTIDEWMDACRIFYHSLMMTATQRNEHPRLQPEWEQLRDFYEKIIFGSRIAKRRTPPTVQKLVYIERHAWQLIIEKLWEDKHLSLPEALGDVQRDSLWWTNELATNSDNPTPTRTPKGGDKSKGQYYNRQDQYYNNKGGKGHDQNPTGLAVCLPKGGGKASPKVANETTCNNAPTAEMGETKATGRHRAIAQCHHPHKPTNPECPDRTGSRGRVDYPTARITTSEAHAKRAATAQENTHAQDVARASTHSCTAETLD